MLKQTAATDRAVPSANEAPSCAVLVCSCDAYRDLWPPFFHLFSCHWPDCPFPIYLGAGKEECHTAGVVTLHSPDKNWTFCFRAFLEQIEAEYVLVLLEDFFLDRDVDTALIQKQLKSLDILGGTVLRLAPKPGPDSALRSHPGIGTLHNNAPYRVSLQAAIWNRRALLTLLHDGESAWEFEWNGTERSRLLPAPFLATARSALRYRHVVERGAWFWSAARRYGRAEIGCDFTKRPVMGPSVAVKKALNRLRKNIANALLPPGLRRRR